MARQRALWMLLAFAAAITGMCGTASAVLPDDRGYELVSPPVKDGSDVMAATSKTVAATAGSAVAFASLRGFGDVHGTSTDAQYLARRNGLAGTTGWTTHAITPAGRSHTPGALANLDWSSFEAAFSPDLSRAIYRAWRPLTDPANTDDFLNLFVMSGLLTGPGASELATDSDIAIPPYPVQSKLLALQPWLDATSTDLSHVLFETGLNLTTDAPPQTPFCAFAGFGCENRLYEYASGHVHLVGRVPSGADATCDDDAGPACVAAPSSEGGISGRLPNYAAGMMSDDGSRIFFQAPVGFDGGKVYMRESGSRTLQLNASEKAPGTRETPGIAQLWAASADGTRAFFTSDEGLVDGDDGGQRDLYMYDASRPAGSRLTLISRSEIGESHVVSAVVGVSDDGHYAYFVANGQLAAGESARPFNGLYVWHDGDIAYIGEFFDGLEAKQNTPRTQWITPRETSTARVTPDGRHVLFMTRRDTGFAGHGGFAGYDQAGQCTYDTFHNGCRELYVYSADTGGLACASCNPTGRTATADAVTDISQGSGAAWITAHLSHALSDDGRYVFFSTAEALVPDDTNRTFDAYEYDVANGSVHLLSSGTDQAPSYFMDASADGGDAFFLTRAQLVGWDVDDSYDLYDARVDGGLPDPVPPAPPCAGAACLPAAGSQPGAAPAASTQYRGRGDLRGKLRKRCPRGRALHRIRGRRKCVRGKQRGHRSRLHAPSGRSDK